MKLKKKLLSRWKGQNNMMRPASQRSHALCGNFPFCWCKVPLGIVQTGFKVCRIHVKTCVNLTNVAVQDSKISHTFWPEFVIWQTLYPVYTMPTFVHFEKSYVKLFFSPAALGCTSNFTSKKSINETEVLGFFHITCFEDMCNTGNLFNRATVRIHPKLSPTIIASLIIGVAAIKC